MSHLLIAVAALLLTAGSSLRAQDAGGTLKRYSDAIKARDTDGLTSLFDANARIVSTAYRDQVPVTRSTPASALVASLRTAKESWEETFRAPHVLEKDNVAMIWAEYDFRLGGQLVYCGVTTFQLVRGAVGWRITSIAETQRKPPCQN